MPGPDEAGKLTMTAGPYKIGADHVAVVEVPRYGRRIVKLVPPKTDKGETEPTLGRPSNCFHGVGLRPKYVPRSAAAQATTDEDLCRLCVFERDRLATL